MQTCFSQLDKTHYIPPLTAADHNSSRPGDQHIYISTPSATNVSFTIKRIGLSSTFDITGIVSNTNPYHIQLPDEGFGQLFDDPDGTSIVNNQRGFLIESIEAPIYVSIRVNSANGAQAGAFLANYLV